MRAEIWLSPEAARAWEALAPDERARTKAALEFLAGAPERGIPLAGPLASLWLYRVEPDLEVIYRPGGRLEVLVLRRCDRLPPPPEEARVVGLVLAAGPAEYRGLPLPLVPVDGRPLITTVTHNLRQAGVGEVIVVLGHAAEVVKAAADLSGAEVVVNANYRHGLATSLRCGLRLARGAAAVLVALADRPFIAPSSIRRLLHRYRESRAPVVLPLYGQQHGHPVVFDGSLLPALQRVRRGGREVVRRYRHQAALVPVDDEGAVKEIS